MSDNLSNSSKKSDNSMKDYDLVEKLTHKDWNKICSFLVPWLQDENCKLTIEQYVELMAQDDIQLHKVLGVMMFLTQQQVVVLPQEIQSVNIYYNAEKVPLGYTIVPKLTL